MRFRSAIPRSNIIRFRRSQEYAEAAIFYSAKQGKNIPGQGSSRSRSMREPYIPRHASRCGRAEEGGPYRTAQSPTRRKACNAILRETMKEVLNPLTSGIRLQRPDSNGFRRKQDCRPNTARDCRKELLFGQKEGDDAEQRGCPLIHYSSVLMPECL